MQNEEPQKTRWRIISLTILLGTLGIAALLIVYPAVALPLFWGIIIPILPAVFLCAPGLWRNICPMALLNQIPREFGFSQNRELPKILSKNAYLISCVLLLVLVSMRKWLFDISGTATVELAVSGLLGAFLGGLFFKGMSGWCSTFCPILPVEKLYGQSRLASIDTTYCQPCIGCTQTCYNRSPDTAALDVQDAPHESSALHARLFAAIFPGYILAFFNTTASMSLIELYENFGIYCAISAALFFVLNILFSKMPRTRLPALFGITALNCYYWYAADGLFKNLSLLTGGWDIPDAAPWAVRGIIWVISVYWIYRFLRREVAHSKAV